ncbi:MAG: orotidine-5'-phosphate decarboxylase [Opitutales bacterium]
MSNSPPEIILALDVESRSKARSILKATGEQLKWVKVGLQSYLRDGPDLLSEIAGLGKQIFLDLKLHDIPNTMSKALESLSSLPINMLTVHATAGPDALSKCSKEAKTMMPEVTLLAVTVLTSMDKGNLSAIGVDSPVEEQVIKLATLASESGIGGVVCSPLELEILRPALPPETKLVTPGIRPSGSDHGDQKRIMTPSQAHRAGADYLVIGRPILAAPEPSDALAKIIGEMG